MDEFLKSAMDLLAARNCHFGWTIKGQRKNATALEKSFQVALHGILNDLSRERKDGWTWCREVRIPVTCLSNEREIAVDILGWHAEMGVVPVELKYVTMQQSGLVFRAPANPPAFPYDVLKDCVKCECLLAGLAPRNAKVSCQGYGAIARSGAVHAVSIGLTNYSAYWDSDSKVGNRCWSRNSFAVLRDEKNIFNGTIQTVKRANLANTIYKQGRSHLSLGYKWHRSWFDYSNCDDLPQNASAFRYVYLRPVCPTEEPDFTHDVCDPAYVPVLKERTRDAFMQQRRNLARG